ncbi:Stp1/IreP family PP2C-type Ser/Thr phosphatase [Spirillospora sp. CA-294931]|uniref:Stp1/IreP family PP2C-type Ser/Thr phosphatase n=1 Tax=Spirillospora sp. CA-294931 TaxID=3240042 RepID=UPI003D8A4A53
MSLGIRYAARSDVGMLREGNEDSAYAGSHLLAVADGMGGHVGGEIASAAAIAELRKLDKDLPANELLAALEHTVKSANDNLHRIVESDPALQGMGTTLTAMLWAGNQIALVHIGDSRAYLLRDGSLFQITHDHTLVQSLVDEGRISPDEAASHPQRSLLLRALDGRGEVDPDLSLRDAKLGDRYLLCSDGLSGVVTAETIFQVLTDVDDPEQSVRQLIDLANRGGGPDNITCVVADVVEVGQQPPPSGGQAVGAAANATPPSPPGAAPPADTPAGRAAQLRETAPQPQIAVDEMPPPPPAPMGGPAPGATMPDPGAEVRMRRRSGGGLRKWTWLIVAAGVAVVAIAAVAFVSLQSIRDGYYVGEEKGTVVLYRGINQDVPLISMSRRADVKDQPKLPIPVAELPKNMQDQVKKTYDVKGPEGLRELEKAVCRYVIAEEKGKLALQRVCQNGTVVQKLTGAPGVATADLPIPDANAVKAGTPKFVTRQQADERLKVLGERAALCKSNAPVQECPNGGKP